MKTDLSQLINANYDGLNNLNMGPNSLWWSDLSAVQFVPSGAILPSKYHTKNRRQFWFSEQIANWINQNNYWNPWMCGNGGSIAADVIPLQFISNGLTPVIAYLYSCSGVLIQTVPLTNILTSAAINATPYLLWEGNINLNGVAPGGYYIDVKAAGGAVEIISEGLNVQVDWPDTLLFEVTSSQNKQTYIFDSNETIIHRVKGFFDNQFKQKYKGAFYVDQPQDIEILNAIQYEMTTLIAGGDDGIPDYEARKIAAYLLLDGCMIEGEGYSMDEGAEWEEMFTPGNPKKYQKIAIRPSSVANATGATAAGADTDSSMIISTDALYFGPNDGSVPGDSQIIDVTIS